MKLRYEIIVLVGIVALGVGLGSAILASSMMHKVLEHNLHNHTETAARGLLSHITPLLRDNNTSEIESEISLLVEQSPTVQYAFVIDFEGKLLAHTFADSFPEHLVMGLSHPYPKTFDQPEIHQYKDESGDIWDIGLPLIEGQKAHIHLGMNEDLMHSQVLTLRNKIIGLTFLLAAIGIVLGFFVSWRLTEPVQEELKKMSQAVMQSPTSIVITDAEGVIEYVNPKFEELTGYSFKESLGNNPRILRSGMQADEYYKDMWNTIKHGETWRGEFSNKKKNGELYWKSATISPILNDQGTITHFIAVKEDITEHKHFEDALKESENRTRTTFNSISDAVFLHPLMDTGFANFLDVNDTACKTYGYTHEQFRGMKAPDITRKVDADQHSKRNYRNVLKDKKKMIFETVHVKSSGEEFPVEINSSVIKLNGIQTILSVVRDLTSRKAAEKEHERLQLQFTQSQKMETVGRLAGGVAHDFNNMLGVIVGHSDLALHDPQLSKSTTGHLTEIRKAASRSANLTRQLLTFARKQTISPKVLDLNGTVEDMLKMLRRLMGEDIDLTWQPGSKTWPIMMDPSQVDQIMANLCVNARDAIADVGKVTIETKNATFDDDFCAIHPDFKPGDFTLIAVSDDGSGMDDQTLDKLFEPFFTTKPMGEGTGLGLATIYGIVKQNNGFITVDTTPDLGSTFKIFLPRHHGAMPPISNMEQNGPLEQGNETVLVVEDETSILRMTARILEIQGYTVFATTSPTEGISIARDPANTIQLLVTDVIMPEMNGKDLAQKLLQYQPDMKCLYMSGYTEDVISHHGVLDEGVHFLPKPFSLANLASMVRQTLDDNENG